MPAPELTLLRCRPVRRLVTGLLAILLGCGGSDTTGPGGGHPTQLTVSADSVILAQHATAHLAVTVRDARGDSLSGYTATFSSADTTIATVSGGGQIASKGPRGRVVVTVQAAGLSAQVPVIVTPVAGTISVTPASPTVTQLDSTPFAVTVLDVIGDPIVGATVTYVPSTPSLVAVTPAGYVVSLGRAAPVTVVVHSGAVSRNVPITIVPKPAAMAITPAGTAQLPVQGTLQLAAAVLDLVGDTIHTAAVTWTATGGLASVSGTGLITAGATPGRITLTASSTSQMFGTIRDSVTTFVTQATLPTAVIPGDLTSLNTGGSPWNVAIAPNGRVIAVSGGGGLNNGMVWSTDLAGFSTIDTVISGGSALDVEIDSSGVLAYAAGAGPGNGISVIDLATLNQVAYLEQGALGQVNTVGLSHDEQRVVMGTQTGNLVIFDAVTRAWRTTLQRSGALFNHIAAHPSLPRLYISSYGGGFLNPSFVAELDLTTETLRVLPILPSRAQGIAVSPDGTELYIADENGPVLVWDIVHDRAAGSIPVATSGMGLFLSPDGQTLYLIGGRVLVIDRTTRVVSKVYDLPASRAGGVSHDGARLVVTDDNGFLERFTP